MRHSKNPIYSANYDLKNVNLNVGDYVFQAGVAKQADVWPVVIGFAWGTVQPL